MKIIASLLVERRVREIAEWSPGDSEAIRAAMRAIVADPGAYDGEFAASQSRVPGAVYRSCAPPCTFFIVYRYHDETIEFLDLERRRRL